MREDSVETRSDTSGSTTGCCVVGGGPAGMMLGLLLARAGVDVTVLEKHGDFLRDFRGDTIHPSSLEVLKELGLLDEFLELPHAKAHQLNMWMGGEELVFADFRRLPVTAPYIAFIPQWDFLTFLGRKAGAYPGFRLLMRTEATDLITRDDRVAGVRAVGPDGPVDIHAELVVAADGRGSVMRERAQLPHIDLGAPIDVLWFRLPRAAGDPTSLTAVFDHGRIMGMIDRGTHWQCAWVIPKGSFEELKGRGLAVFRSAVGEMGSFLADRVGELRDWDDIKQLTVRVDRLERWYRPGLLCIGDAAHAMSPIGGIGINLAIQDAVAAANLLAAPLRDGTLDTSHLRAVQRRRLPPTRLTQRLQVMIQRRMFGRASSGGAAPDKLPLPLRLMRRFPFLRRLPARVIGMGFRPEHVR